MPSRIFLQFIMLVFVSKALRIKKTRNATSELATLTQSDVKDVAKPTLPTGQTGEKTWYQMFEEFLLKHKKVADFLGVVLNECGLGPFDGGGAKALVDAIVHVIDLSQKPDYSKCYNADPINKNTLTAKLTVAADMIAKEILLDRKDCFPEYTNMTTKSELCTAKCIMAILVAIVNFGVKVGVEKSEEHIAGFAAVMIAIIKDIYKALQAMQATYTEDQPWGPPTLELSIALARAGAFISIGVVTGSKSAAVIANSALKAVGEAGANYMFGQTEDLKLWIEQVIAGETVNMFRTMEEVEQWRKTRCVDPTLVGIEKSLEVGDACAKRVAKYGYKNWEGFEDYMNNPTLACWSQENAYDPSTGIPSPENLLDNFFRQAWTAGGKQKYHWEMLKVRYESVPEREVSTFELDQSPFALKLQSCRAARLVCRNLNYNPGDPFEMPVPIDGDTGFQLAVLPNGHCVHFEDEIGEQAPGPLEMQDVVGNPGEIAANAEQPAAADVVLNTNASSLPSETQPG